LGQLNGSVRGVVFYEMEEGGENIGAGTVKGDVIGNYIDVEEPGTDTWQAAGIGEWVEATELLTPDNLGFTLSDLEEFVAVSVPITEVYTNLLTGTNDFITQATMDISIYNNSLTSLWAAVMWGTYNPAEQPTVEDQSWWGLSLSQGSDVVNLEGSLWAGNEWLAGVEGTVGGDNITGEAGGTYGEGAFQGVGAGVANPPVTP